MALVAQWTRLLTANQRIAGSSPAKVIDIVEAFFGNHGIILVRICACHAEGPGSIPGQGL